MKQTYKEDLKIIRITNVVVFILKIGLQKSLSVKVVLPLLVL